LQKSKNKVESLLAFTEVNIMNRALGLATYEWLGDANMINEEPKKYAQITAAQLQETAQKYLQTSNSSVLYYASKK
jgi:predicted Zn-dependent peptidase